jgi:hypothetical protein
MSDEPSAALTKARTNYAQAKTATRNAINALLEDNDELLLLTLRDDNRLAGTINVLETARTEVWLRELAGDDVADEYLSEGCKQLAGHRPHHIP